MRDKPAPPFHLSDEPTSSSVSMLVVNLRDDSAEGLVSPRVYAHRSRVIRQQSIRLSQQSREALADADASKAKRMRKAARPQDHREEGGEG
jgi:hypothetical protein